MSSSGVNLFFSLFAASVMLFLGILVYFHNRKGITNRIFFAHSFVIAVWSIANYFSLAVPPEAALFWIRLVICMAVPHVFIFFIFVENFPDDHLLITKPQVILLTSLMVLMMALTFSPYIFSSVSVVGNQAVPNIGGLMPVFAVILVVLSVLTIGLVVKKYFKSSGVIKRQWSAIGLGLLVAYVLLIYLVFLQVILFGNTFFVQYSPLFIIPIFIGTAYAILRHNLLNIKAIATEVMTGVLLITSLIQVFLASNVFNLIISAVVSIFLLIFGIFLTKSILKEVEQRQRLEALTHELQIANLKLKELDQQKTDFLSIAAHQLRTPVSIMNGYIELIEDNAYGKVSKETREILNNMDQSNQRLLKLVDEFLDITRIEQGRTKFDFIKTDISIIIDGIVKEQSERAKEKGIKVVWEKPRKKMDASVDEDKIRHVIYNFLDNALKYSEKGTITISVSEKDKGIEVVVADQGFGFNKTDENNFFQKFYRGENVKHTHVTGTGLGLFVCRRFIEAHKGKIWAHSDGLGKGSEFGLWVPVAQG